MTRRKAEALAGGCLLLMLAAVFGVITTWLSGNQGGMVWALISAAGFGLAAGLWLREAAAHDRGDES